MLAVATSPPVVNQIQLSPFNFRKELIDEGRSYGLAHEADSPLGTGTRLVDPNIQAMVARNDRKPSKVLIRWGLQHGFVVPSKSIHREYLAGNTQAQDFALSDTHMRKLATLDAGSVPGQARELKWW